MYCLNCSSGCFNFSILLQVKDLLHSLKDKINVFDFLFGTNWNPSDIGADGKPMVGALPMIAGSLYCNVFVSDCCDTICDWSGCFFMTEISPKKGAKIFYNQLLNYL